MSICYIFFNLLSKAQANRESGIIYSNMSGITDLKTLKDLLNVSFKIRF
jgi:hypothetical protein